MDEEPLQKGTYGDYLRVLSAERKQAVASTRNQEKLIADLDAAVVGAVEAQVGRSVRVAAIPGVNELSDRYFPDEVYRREREEEKRGTECDLVDVATPAPNVACNLCGQPLSALEHRRGQKAHGACTYAEKVLANPLADFWVRFRLEHPELGGDSKLCRFRREVDAPAEPQADPDHNSEAKGNVCPSCDAPLGSQRGFCADLHGAACRQRKSRKRIAEQREPGNPIRQGRPLKGKAPRTAYGSIRLGRRTAALLQEKGISVGDFVAYTDWMATGFVGNCPIADLRESAISCFLFAAMLFSVLVH